MKFGYTAGKKLHLDSEYRKRWEEFLHADGTVDDSRKVNWRNVRWDDLIKITAYVNGQIHEVTAKHDKFRFFMNFRWNGKKAIYENGVYKEHKPINEWTIGWTDGVNSYLKYIDFYTGNLIKETVEPLEKHKIHIHPSFQ